MNIQTLNQTIKTLEGVRNAVGSFTRADVDLTLGLLRREAEALAEQPAQRTWVGLTLGERNELCRAVAASTHQVRAIEAKLKEKNT